MRILGWNCRGICNASTVHALRAKIRVFHPEVIFLSETKASEARISKVAKLVGYSNFFSVDAVGKAGGICMLWNYNVQAEIMDFESHLIALKITDVFGCWTLAGFYGPPYKTKQSKAWVNLHAFLDSIVGPWLCMGDFNTITMDSEKEGGRAGNSSSTNFLNDLMFDLGAIDLGFTGNKFTWSNKRWGRGSIRERLDRGIANVNWRMTFPKAVIYHLGAINSDHSPLLLDTNPLDIHCPRPFRFIAAWIRDSRCAEIVHGAWQKSFFGCDSFKLFQKQKNTAMALKKWNKEEFGFCHTRIKELSSQIESLQCNQVSETNARLEGKLLGELNEWLIRTDVLWKQKSRELWLRDGDRNTKFFHLSTIIRRRHNSIDAVRSDSGDWIIDQKGIREHFQTKFISLFSEEETFFPPDLEHLIHPSISSEDNVELCRVPTPDEIKGVLFDMQSLKAPGPDGFPPVFYKHFWPTVGANVIKAVQSFFTNGKMLPETNRNFIVLIPKIPNPSTVNHYRPISLCNVVYKVISKLLVVKLRPFLDKLISPSQSAFVPGRWIAENQVLVKELMHSFNTRKVKEGFIALKIDLKKAYDRINWGFLQVVLQHFGFSGTFVNWVLQCVTTSSSALLINGGKTESFNPSRGLRQGDPLSPYLFIMCQEVLSRIIDRQFALRKLSGAKMNVAGPPITHVMFADDLMLFTKASRKEATVLNECLDTYCLWSGQQINRDKSGIIFSKMVCNSNRRWIKGELQMKKLPLDAFYLGTPMFSSKCKTKDFKYLIERTEARLQGWRSKCLSWAGRRTLINSVALALPMYSFSTTCIPTTVCNKLDSTIRRFWWNPRKSQGRYLAWKSWEALCCSKKEGGLGFRKSKTSNQAMLAKLAWLILTKADSLCVKALCSKYKVGVDWMSKEARKNASPLWKAIESLKSLLAKGACYLLGDGQSIDFWKDPWIPWVVGFSPVPKDPTYVLDNIKVTDLIKTPTRTWNIEVLANLVDPQSLDAILKVPIPIHPCPDKLVWTLDPRGVFSVKSAANAVITPRLVSPAEPKWDGLWKLKLHERQKIFMWRLGSNILPTKLNLAIRLGHGDPMCPLCGIEEESYSHLFLHCQKVRPLWFGLSWGIRTDLIPASTSVDFVSLVVQPPLCPNPGGDNSLLRAQASIQVASTLESIWNFRNQMVHEGCCMNILTMVHQLEAKILEQFLPLQSTASKVSRICHQWKTPPPLSIKLNVDAAISNSSSTIAVVARNSEGFLLKSWAKAIASVDPCVAEAAALAWAMELAVEEQYLDIVVEGDAKVCIDAILGFPTNTPWKIYTFIANISSLVSLFHSCCFCWVGREANQMAHCLAKFGSHLTGSFQCNDSNLPPSLQEAWLRDLSFSSR
jgi:hypothetical protein